VFHKANNEDSVANTTTFITQTIFAFTKCYMFRHLMIIIRRELE